jgi:flagellar capping protein FliD
MTINNNSTLFTGLQHTQLPGALGHRGVNSHQWRGGVTGWEHTERTRPNSGSSGGLPADDARAFLEALKSFGNALSNATSMLRSPQSGFNQMAGNSSNNNAMTIGVTNQQEARQFFNAGGSMEVGVSQLAAAQRNTGHTQTATGISNADNGINYFSIARDDGKSFQFNIEVNASDSNRTVQQKMADAINRQNTGINAAVEVNSRTNESTLVLTTRETGERQGFTIEDGSRGNAVAALGLNENVQEARDAVYTVNGEERTSASNTVNLGNGLNAALRQTTAEDVTVTAQRDNNAINNNIREMVNNFNQLREAAVNNNSDSGAQRLQRQLDNISQAFGTTLANIGITQNQNGYLQIDNERLTASIENGSAERALGENSTISQRINQVAQSADNNPNQFISRQSRGNLNSTPVNDNYLDNIRFTSRQQNMMNHWDTVGMLLSMGV